MWSKKCEPEDFPFIVNKTDNTFPVYVCIVLKHMLLRSKDFVMLDLKT